MIGLIFYIGLVFILFVNLLGVDAVINIFILLVSICSIILTYLLFNLQEKTKERELEQSMRIQLLDKRLDGLVLFKIMYITVSENIDCLSNYSPPDSLTIVASDFDCVARGILGGTLDVEVSNTLYSNIDFRSDLFGLYNTVEVFNCTANLDDETVYDFQSEYILYLDYLYTMYTKGEALRGLDISKIVESLVAKFEKINYKETIDTVEALLILN